MFTYNFNISEENPEAKAQEYLQLFLQLSENMESDKIAGLDTQARPFFEEVFQQDPANIPVSTAYMMILQNAKDWEAMDVMLKLAEENGHERMPYLFMNAGLHAMEAGQPQRGEYYLEKALLLGKEDFDFKSTFVERLNQRIKQAIYGFEQAPSKKIATILKTRCLIFYYYRVRVLPNHLEYKRELEVLAKELDAEAILSQLD